MVVFIIYLTAIKFVRGQLLQPVQIVGQPNQNILFESTLKQQQPQLKFQSQLQQSPLTSINNNNAQQLPLQQQQPQQQHSQRPQQTFQDQEQINSNHQLLANQARAPATIEFTYHNYDAMTNLMHNISKNFPDIVRVYSIGRSVQGECTNVNVINQ